MSPIPTFARALGRVALPALVFAFAALAAPGAARAVNVEKVTSPGGITAWLVRDPTIPVISVDIAFRGSAALDPAGKEGLATMVSGLLDEGAGDLDSEAFQGKLNDLAIRFGFDAGLDYFTGQMKTLKQNRDTAFNLLHLALTKPRFDPEPVERIRNQVLTILNRNAEDPEHIAGETWFRTVFPDHPYGRPVDGTPKSIKAITAADLHAFVKARLARDNLVIGVVGDITPKELAPLLDSTFGALPAHAAPDTVADTEPKHGGETVVVQRDIPQSVVVFGEKGLKRHDPDFYAAYVMNYILGGGGFSSRLTQEVRVKRGLAYSVYTYLNPMEHAALISGGVATRNGKVKESIDIIRKEWARLHDLGVTDAELADAKSYLTGSFPLRLDTTDKIAQTLVVVQLERLGIDYLDKRNGLIRAVTKADVDHVAKRVIDPAALTFVIVGKPDGVSSAGAPSGPIPMPPQEPSESPM